MNHISMPHLNWLEKRLYEDRIYEGEWIFVCTPPCPGYIVEYAFTGWNDASIEAILSNRTGGHALENCHLCGGVLEWAGYPLQLPITQCLINLLNDHHFMASTVMLAAIIDNSISNLLWAAFADNGIGTKKANEVVKTRIARSDALHMIRSITSWPIDNIVFPTRNLVAHGKGFRNDEHFYRDELIKQVASIREWVKTICQEVKPTHFIPKETDRWLLFIDHWSSWLTSITNHITLMPWKGPASKPSAFTIMKALIDEKHYMVSTVILAAIIEDVLNDLLRSLLIDRDMDKDQANKLVNGNLGRVVTLQMIRSISTCPIKDIVFPLRNLVAHGRGFAKGDAFYRSELVKQLANVCMWIQQTSTEIRTNGSARDKCNLWLSLMDDLSSQLTSLNI